MRVLIVGGGTGGHLFPAVALAETFMKRSADNQVHFVTTQRALDSQVLGGRGFSSTALKMEGMKGKGVVRKLKALVQLPRAFRRSLKIIGEYRPEMVLGVGGYVSGPVVLAAWWKGIPCAIQEQNSIPGVTNRLLSRVANRVFGAFKENETYFPKIKLQITGNPIRLELQKTADRPAPLSGPLTLLILGGSQGAHRINQVVKDCLEDLLPLKNELYFIHQTGDQDEEELARTYQEKGFKHRVLAFISDMAWAYGQADMIIGRAGAMTLTEITALGKPSLLIPFPFAANNHQEHNARSLIKAGAAEMILEKDLDPGVLSGHLRDWLAHREKLIEMGEKAKTMGRWQAAEEIVEGCYRLVEGRKRVQ